jgi:hypothetical protein
MVVCVLGMHRSGTSCVAGTLQAAGVFLGEVFTRSDHNFKGNRESGVIMALHNDVLAANAGQWYDPPPLVRWSDTYRARRDEIIAGMAAAAPCWGFKDPRTLLVLDGWLEALADPRFVGVVRHPQAVARSLQRRVGMPSELALRLWSVYNRRLAEYQASFDVPIICFDQPAAELLGALRRLCSRLGLDATAAETFFDQDLRHHDGGAEPWDDVPGADRALYEQLCSGAL